MNNYKNTLNLPNTNFPMRGNLSQKEPEILKKWNKYNIYNIIRKKNKGKKIFLLHDGPPYANGNIHIGHCINKILKDIIIKYKTLSGFDTPYTPFWDCHGLPIEHKIEKKIGKPGNKITKKKFRDICKKYVIQQVEKQKSDFIRLGIFGDWNNAKLTTDKNLEANVINILRKIIKNKYLYQGLKPVHWCLICESALAEAEVEYNNKYSKSIIFSFQTKENDILHQKFLISQKINNISIIIWTTTPWTVPANRAIAIHPNVKYQLIQFQKHCIIIAKKMVSNIINILKIKNFSILGTIIGKKLENIKFKHPFLDLEIPIILSHHVTMDTGTGAVHIAPDYGNDDYNISIKYNIPITNIIDSKGNYRNNIHPKIDGKNITKINQTIIELLKERNCLFLSEDILHSHPHCWRHKKPIIFRTTKQWFINIENSSLKKKSINLINEVKWIPKWGKNHMYNMIKKRPDWCISRQRTWGVPITVLINKKTGELHPKTNEILKKIEKIIEKNGSEAWWNLKTKDIIENNYKEYKKSNDVLDVWFESGCTHTIKISNLINNKENTTNMFLEGSDQYRGWFMSSLIISQAIQKSKPYNIVLAHGFVIDQSGHKMSKSIGNVINPKEIIQSFGADVLRLWVASANYTNDIIISKNILKQISEYYRKIRNTSRFLLSNIYDFNPNINTINYENMIFLDKWIISKTESIQKKIILLYKQYKFHEVIQKIIKFCSIEMGSFYLDIIKDRQYTFKKNSLARRSCQTAMYYIIQSMVRWILPILPFTADEIWNYLPEKKNKWIFTEKWFNLLLPLSNKEIINKKTWSKLIIIKTEINKLIEENRNNKIIKNSLETTITLYIKKDLYNILNILKKEIKFMLLVSETKIKNYILAPKNTYRSNCMSGLKIEIQKYLGIKCPRCWHYFNIINLNNQDKNICNRCNNNIYGTGEIRKFL